VFSHDGDSDDHVVHRADTAQAQALTRWRHISLLGRQRFDCASIRVSKISLSYKNCRRVPTLCKHLCTLHFASAWKFSIAAQQITWRHDRNSKKSQLVTSRYIFRSVENNVGITQWFVILKKVSSFQLKLLRNHDLNDCAPMDILFKKLCLQPSNPNTIWKLRLLASCMWYYFLVSYWWVL
jgi:hypothetical protein